MLGIVLVLLPPAPGTHLLYPEEAALLGNGHPCPQDSDLPPEAGLALLGVPPLLPVLARGVPHPHGQAGKLLGHLGGTEAGLLRNLGAVLHQEDHHPDILLLCVQLPPVHPLNLPEDGRHLGRRYRLVEAEPLAGVLLPVAGAVLVQDVMDHVAVVGALPPLPGLLPLGELGVRDPALARPPLPPVGDEGRLAGPRVLPLLPVPLAYMDGGAEEGAAGLGIVDHAPHGRCLAELARGGGVPPRQGVVPLYLPPDRLGGKVLVNGQDKGGAVGRVVEVCHLPSPAVLPHALERPSPGPDYLVKVQGAGLLAVLHLEQVVVEPWPQGEGTLRVALLVVDHQVEGPRGVPDALEAVPAYRLQDVALGGELRALVGELHPPLHRHAPDFLACRDCPPERLPSFVLCPAGSNHLYLRPFDQRYLVLILPEIRVEAVPHRLVPVDSLGHDRCLENPCFPCARSVVPERPLFYRGHCPGDSHVLGVKAAKPALQGNLPVDSERGLAASHEPGVFLCQGFVEGLRAGVIALRIIPVVKVVDAMIIGNELVERRYPADR